MKRPLLRALVGLLAVGASAQTRVSLDPALAAPRVFAPAFPSAAGISPAAAMPLLVPAAPAAALAAPVAAFAAAPPAFDGSAAAAAAAGDGIPANPEEFARRARALFEAVRRAETDAAGAAPEAVATDGEMRGRLERLPATNPEREKYVVELFRMAGAAPEDIVFQDAGRGRRNVLVVKKGRTDRVIVVGGHHDKVSVGAGSIDNGTGATMVANLYQALHDQDTEATIVFVAFAREEEGLVGSQHYLAALGPEQRGKIDAMVNLDTLAVDGTFSWQNNSTRALLDRVRVVAAADGRALVEAHLDGGDADSSTFREAGIPAITIFGASQDVIFDIIHTERDTMAAFDLGHYKNAYLLTLDFLKSLDARPLGRVDGV